MFWKSDCRVYKMHDTILKLVLSEGCDFLYLKVSQWLSTLLQGAPFEAMQWTNANFGKVIRGIWTSYCSKLYWKRNSWLLAMSLHGEQKNCNNYFHTNKTIQKSLIVPSIVDINSIAEHFVMSPNYAIFSATLLSFRITKWRQRWSTNVFVCLFRFNFNFNTHNLTIIFLFKNTTILSKGRFLFCVPETQNENCAPASLSCWLNIVTVEQNCLIKLISHFMEIVGLRTL